MGKVIGPIELDDWYLMRQLRESVRDMKERNPEKYRLAIDTHSKTYKEILKDSIKEKVE